MSAPLPFVAEALEGLSPGRALDLACGRGRHLALLAERGWRVTGIDRDAERLAECRALVPDATLFADDIESEGWAPPEPGTWDVVLTTFFLYRPLVPAIAAALAPGGRWLLETFHVDNHLRRGHPRRRHLCLAAGEAGRLARAAGLDVVSIDERERGTVCTVRLIARRPRPAH